MKIEETSEEEREKQDFFMFKWKYDDDMRNDLHILPQFFSFFSRHKAELETTRKIEVFCKNCCDKSIETIHFESSTEERAMKRKKLYFFGNLREEKSFSSDLYLYAKDFNRERFLLGGDLNTNLF